MRGCLLPASDTLARQEKCGHRKLPSFPWRPCFVMWGHRLLSSALLLPEFTVWRCGKSGKTG